MEALVKFVDNMMFIGKGESNRSIIMDSSPKVGGEDTAIRPAELLLQALCGCTGMDTVSILKKMKVDFDHFELFAKSRAKEDYPKIITHIDLEYRFKVKDLNDKNKFIKAIDLTQNKYCQVSLLYKKAGVVMKIILVLNDDVTELS